MPPELADVSVIMPAWRAEATIARALASVAAQTRRPLEVVVVDDGSTDGTVAAAEACRSLLDPTRLVILRQDDNRGAGAARNRALAEAGGSLVAFLDADDEWLPSKLERSLEQWEDGLAFVSHDMLVDQARVDCARHFQDAADPALALFVRGFVATSTVLARRAAVLAAGGFDESLRSAQDYNLWLTLAVGGRFKVFGEALTRYHTTPDSITSHVDRRRECNLVILRRHLPAFAAQCGSGRAAKAAATRVMAMHYESWSGHRAAGRHLRALAQLAQLPFNLLAAVPPRLMAGLLWLWLAGIMAAYLWQFRGLMGPVLQTLGVTWPS